MNHLRIVVIHQWWLKEEELSALLFAGRVTHEQTSFYPYFTDCSESVFVVARPDMALFSEALLKETDLQSAFPTVVEGARWEHSGRAIDPRIVSISVEIE